MSQRDYIKLIFLFIKFGVLTFEGDEYRQIRGLATGSLLSAVTACLHMETLETDKYNRIMRRESTRCRYVNDVLVVDPENTNIGNKLRMLNEVGEHIQFTVEKEENARIPFLETLLLRSGQNVRTSVYRKQTNKDDFVHYLSAHSERT